MDFYYGRYFLSNYPISPKITTNLGLRALRTTTARLQVRRSGVPARGPRPHTVRSDQEATMSVFQRFVTRTRLVASDSWNLASTLLKARPTTIPSARAALMQCVKSNNGNIVAESALRFDREVGLLRYHGFGGYVTAKGGVRALLLPSAPVSGDGAGGFNLTRFLFGPPSGHGREARVGATEDSGTVTAKSTDATSSAKKARVAFMITAAQRQRLNAELGYSAEDIRSLKPLEALLILEHKIEPGNEEKVNRLVNENEELERQEAERAEREMAASAAEVEELDAAEFKKDVLHTTASTQGHAANSTDEDKATLALAAGANTNQYQDAEPASLPNQDKISDMSLSSAISEQSAAVQQALSRPLSGDDPAQDVPNDDIIRTTSMIDESDDMTWYEVVETKAQAPPTSDETVIALYQTLEEAEDCLKWKEERGEGKFTYQIRQRT